MASRLPLIPEQGSALAGDVDNLTLFLIAITVFFSVLIFVAIFVFAIKYRRRSANELPAVEHHGRGTQILEITWSVIPFGITMIIFLWGAALFFKNSRPPDNAMSVYVVGKQWMWKIEHMEGRREINELHIPVGRPIKLTMTSEDVIHSFYIPAMRTKSDVVPGKYSTLWFEPNKVGKYHLFCAEFCGTRHSEMIGYVYVMEPQDYQNWLNSEPPLGTMAENGAKLFNGMGCATCHKADGSGRCPSLHGLFGKTVQLNGGAKVVADESYIRESITQPQEKIVAGYGPLMPTYQGQSTEEDLMQLVEYIKWLGDKPVKSDISAGPLGDSEKKIPARIPGEQH